ncbi:hypothetical protein OE88DRAFT_1725193 [Heliocybe sulcata]|uniref:Uncharacterized protein n=1 Tax=Heliocybe sulcata TaxID=5364 RepID=A0A5C3N4L4_9AGAM|nr:hypothetical protein OE88DRAFT_1725193 [Heliocybe sulcata]
MNEWGACVHARKHFPLQLRRGRIIVVTGSGTQLVGGDYDSIFVPKGSGFRSLGVPPVDAIEPEEGEDRVPQPQVLVLVRWGEVTSCNRSRELKPIAAYGFANAVRSVLACGDERKHALSPPGGFEIVGRAQYRHGSSGPGASEAVQNKDNVAIPPREPTWRGNGGNLELWILAEAVSSSSSGTSTDNCTCYPSPSLGSVGPWASRHSEHSDAPVFSEMKGRLTPVDIFRPLTFNLEPDEDGARASWNPQSVMLSVHQLYYISANSHESQDMYAAQLYGHVPRLSATQDSARQENWTSLGPKDAKRKFSARLRTSSQAPACLSQGRRMSVTPASKLERRVLSHGPAMQG